MLDRLLVAVAGLCGAAGVALAALAAHRPEAGGYPGLVSGLMLAHAPAFLAIGLAGAGRRLLGLAALVILAGLLLFSLDLLARTYAGGPPFPYAAPTGGLLMIAGWLALALSPLFARTRG